MSGWHLESLKSVQMNEFDCNQSWRHKWKSEHQQKEIEKFVTIPDWSEKSFK